MRNSGNHILTSHAGSLPRPKDLLDANRARSQGKGADDKAFHEQLRIATANVVRRQKSIGIDVPNDGEYGHVMNYSINFGAWWGYAFERLSGLDAAEHLLNQPPKQAASGI